MKGWVLIIIVILGFGWLVGGCSSNAKAANPRSPDTVRVATYNLQWFSEDANPKRIKNLRSVIQNIDANVFGLQESQSLRALRQIFDDSWDIGMVDDPEDQQETAIAVRKPFVLVSAMPVFAGTTFDNAFPGRRDVFRRVIQTPLEKKEVVYVVHMKSRRAGRLGTAPQRQFAW